MNQAEVEKQIQELAVKCHPKSRLRMAIWILSTLGHHDFTHANFFGANAVEKHVNRAKLELSKVSV